MTSPPPATATTVARGRAGARAAPIRPSRRPRRGVPVRVRVTALAAFVLAASLAAGSWMFLAALRHAQLSDLETAALRRRDEVVQLVQTGQATGKLPAARDSGLWAQVVDPGGHVLAATDNVRDLAAMTRFSEARSVVGETIQSTAVIDGARCLLWATGVKIGGRVVTVFIAAPLTTVDHSFNMLRSRLLAVAPIVLALSAAALWFVVGRALRPVNMLRREVDAISPRELDRRVSPPRVDDEVGKLAHTMNALLDRLQGASDRQARFVSDASHELRSPLAFVRTRLEVALRQPERVDWPATVTEVLREGQRMERLVADLLYLARADGGSLIRDPRPVDLDDVVMIEVRNARELTDKTIDAKGVSAGRVLGDTDNLRRVVANLIDNAVRYATSRVTLDLSVAVSDVGGSVLLRVDDDGPGIPPAERERVFERFTRVDDSRARRTGGAGLGLAIVREIVMAHGGQIGVADAPGGGARFLVALPVHD